MLLWSITKRRPLFWAVILLTVISLWLLLPGKRASSPTLPKTFTYHKPGKYWTSFADVSNLFVFGDSWSSIELKTCEMFQPDEASHFGNPKFPGITSSNGMNWVGYLAQEFNRSVLHTYDLAVAGSVIDNNVIAGLLDNDFGYALSELIDPVAPCPYIPKDWDPKDSLFTVFLGLNDIMVCHINISPHNKCDIHKPPMSELFQSYTALMEKLYAFGARNFLLLNAPPMSSDVALGRLPDDDIAQAHTSAFHLFNQHHKQLANYLRTTMADVTVFEFDTWELFHKIHHTPQALEDTAVYKNVSNICLFYGPFKWSQVQEVTGQKVTEVELHMCGGLRPEEFLWNSPGHVTWPAHKAIARGVVELLDAHEVKRVPGDE